MTTIAVSPAVRNGIHGLCLNNGVRAPEVTATEAIWTPDLSPIDLAIVNDIVALLESGMSHLTPAEYANIRPQLVIIRDLRQMGRNAFMALSATERDRLLYDAQAATTTILLAVLRE
jgi:hypothetical protein